SQHSVAGSEVYSDAASDIGQLRSPAEFAARAVVRVVGRVEDRAIRQSFSADRDRRARAEVLRRYGELQLLIRDRDLLGSWDDDHRRLVRIDKCKPVKFESLVGGDRVWAGDRAADGVEESVVDRAARERPGARQ